MKIVGLFFLSITISFAQPSDRLIEAIHRVESSGSFARGIVGDGGKAKGPFQIHLAAWMDAVQFDKSIGGTYEDCDEYYYSKKVLIAYLTRYGKGKTEIEMARIWNAGPKGHLKAATLGYAKKISLILGKN